MVTQSISASAGAAAHVPEMSPSTRGRIAAGLYLFVICFGIVAQVFIADKLVVSNNAEQTAANILANTSLYRLAFTLFMLEMAAQMAMIAMFYDVLKPVNKSVARLSAILGLMGAGIKTFARVFFYAPLILLGGASYLAVIEPSQLAALSLIALKVGNQAAAIGLVFFGFESVRHGWLVFRSGFLPKFLGVISVVGGFGWLTYLWPPLGNEVFMFVALFALVGSLLTCGWLLIRGVDNTKWSARASLAATSTWR